MKPTKSIHPCSYVRRSLSRIEPDIWSSLPHHDCMARGEKYTHLQLTSACTNVYVVCVLPQKLKVSCVFFLLQCLRFFGRLQVESLQAVAEDARLNPQARMAQKSMKDRVKDQAQRQRHLAKRAIEMQQTKKEAEARKARYLKETGGMQYTAVAMANRS